MLKRQMYSPIKFLCNCNTISLSQNNPVKHAGERLATSNITISNLLNDVTSI